MTIKIKIKVKLVEDQEKIQMDVIINVVAVKNTYLILLFIHI
jgi:hypothetical protein